MNQAQIKTYCRVKREECKSQFAFPSDAGNKGVSPLYLGFDIGSISTKAVVVDAHNEIYASSYLWTEGDPIGATKRVLDEIKKQLEGKDILIIGVGTTGSARELIGAVLEADIVKNEITAHAMGTLAFHSDIKTIFEIGGQDSKIIIIEDGIVVDYAMNTLCLSEDTKITTNPNYLQTPIKEIKIGEKVLTHKGEFKKVKQIFRRDYRGEIIRIKMTNLKKIEITPEHPILGIKREDIKCYQSYSRNNIPICKPPEERSCNKRCAKYKRFSWQPKFILAKEFKKGDFIAVPAPLKTEDIKSINYNQIKEKQPLEKSMASRLKNIIAEFPLKSDLLRLLGYYLAEGSISYNYSRKNRKIKYPRGISLVFNIREENYAKEISKIISQNFSDINVIVTKIPARKTLIVEIHSRCLAEFVKYLCGSYSDKKRLSKELLNLNPKLQKEILIGFFRGDGQLRKRAENSLASDKKGNRYCASTVSENLASQLYWLLLRNRIKCTITKSSSKTKGGKYAYFISVHGKEINKLESEALINPEKSSDKSFIFSNWLLEPIRKIEKYDFKGEVYNLEVDEDNSYVANFLTVHNCAAGTGAFLTSQARRLNIPVEEFGGYALKSKSLAKIAGRCTVFAESDLVHKAQTGYTKEDLIAGLCHSIVNNYLNNVGKGKVIEPPIVFQGGVSKNIGVVKAFENIVGHKIMVDELGHLMGAIGSAILAKNKVAETERKIPFDFNIRNVEFKTMGIDCGGCPNDCEVLCILKDGKLLDVWGNRCPVGLEKARGRVGFSPKES